MVAVNPLQEARAAYDRSSWSLVRLLYGQVEDRAALSLDDLERYAIAAHLTGEEAQSRDILTRGYRSAVALDDVTRAARFAFWVGHSMIFTNEIGQANGWLGRARNLLSERGVDCVEFGYLMIPVGVEQFLGAADAAAAYGTFTEAVAIARRFADATLLAMAGHGRGRVLIRLGSIDEGMASLDEAMISVAAGEVCPLTVGHVYCGVLEACQEVLDLRRAREWTAVVSRWCEGQPDLVPYRGPCLVHRVEIMRLRGDWEDAIEEARRACDWLSSPTSPEGPEDAFYQLGELYRLRGDLDAAEDAYRQASRMGREPVPGLALVWLVRGQRQAAANAIKRALEEGGSSPGRRAELLAAYIEVLLACRDVRAAEEARDELVDLASRTAALIFRALAHGAEGAVSLAMGQAASALAPLRLAWSAWKELDAPYEAARIRVLIGAACRALGDEQSAAMEMDAARWVFDRLGAASEFAGLVNAGAQRRGSSAAGGLSQREIEVLSLVAAGLTNKAIAAELVLSDHTVARHVQNMLQKLGVSSRASLAAYAVENGLTGPAGHN